MDKCTSSEQFTMFWLLFLVCLTGLSQLTEAQVVREGKCPKVRPFRGRDPTRLYGTWYKAEQFFYGPDYGLKCVTFDVSAGTEPGSVYNVRVGGYDPIAQKRKSYSAVAYALSGNAGLRLNFNVPAYLDEELILLDTDVVNFLVMYSCRGNGKQIAEHAFVVTRQPDGFSPSIRKRVYNVLMENGINPKNLIPVHQAGCELPVPNVIGGGGGAVFGVAIRDGSGFGAGADDGPVFGAGGGGFGLSIGGSVGGMFTPRISIGSSHGIDRAVDIELGTTGNEKATSLGSVRFGGSVLEQALPVTGENIFVSPSTGVGGALAPLITQNSNNIFKQTVFL